MKTGDDSFIEAEGDDETEVLELVAEPHILAGQLLDALRWRSLNPNPEAIDEWQKWWETFSHQLTYLAQETAYRVIPVTEHRRLSYERLRASARALGGHEYSDALSKLVNRFNKKMTEEPGMPLIYYQDYAAKAYKWNVGANQLFTSLRFGSGISDEVPEPEDGVLEKKRYLVHQIVDLHPGASLPKFFIPPLVHRNGKGQWVVEGNIADPNCFSNLKESPIFSFVERFCQPGFRHFDENEELHRNAIYVCIVGSESSIQGYCGKATAGVYNRWNQGAGHLSAMKKVLKNVSTDHTLLHLSLVHSWLQNGCNWKDVFVFCVMQVAVQPKLLALQDVEDYLLENNLALCSVQVGGLNTARGRDARFRTPGSDERVKDLLRNFDSRRQERETMGATNREEMRTVMTL